RLPGRGLARLRHAHQASDHVAAGAHRRLRDGRGRRGCAGGDGAGGACHRRRARPRRGARAVTNGRARPPPNHLGPGPASRPVAAGRISPRRAVAFAVVLLALSFGVMVAFDNLLAAALALSGGAYYVLVYTLWLKRTTPQNIVIGGAAGAIPTLSGWAAARGHLGLGAGFLFSIVFLWTPPHFLALAPLLGRPYAPA